jgi:anti-anti-sigma factor
VIAVGGEADMNADGELQDAIREAVRATVEGGGERVIVIDLAEATFVDSRIIGTLVRWSQDLGAKDWKVPLVCDDEQLLRLFAAIGLAQTLDIHPTLASAQAV